MGDLTKVINLPLFADERGSLVAIETAQRIPFDIKRVYYLYGNKIGVARGFHAHQALQQVAVCVAGRCRMMLDNGSSREFVWLDCPTKGVVIGSMVWHEMHDFSEGCVLLVLASDHYDESDYIRNYRDFRNKVQCV